MRRMRVSSSWKKVYMKAAGMWLVHQEMETLISMEAGGAGQTNHSKEFV